MHERMFAMSNAGSDITSAVGDWHGKHDKGMTTVSLDFLTHF